MILEEIYTYPVKSTHRVTHLYSQVHPWGLEGDRRWMMIDENDRFITQREIPRLSLIQAVPQLSGQLVLTAPGQTAILTEIPYRTAMTVSVTIWDDTVIARVADDPINSWLSHVLGHTLRLVYMHDSNSRRITSSDCQLGASVSFADGFPLLCTTTASLEELNNRLDVPLPMGRFRPNVVVSGNHPFAEDDWKRIQIGEVIFQVIKPCKRCLITTVDQDTASQGKEPLRTLNQFRKINTNVYFGINMIPENTGRIERGNMVEVLQ
ncbi:MAG: MOSC domain-containing protein [Bacteroidetes bacterium]|nr:MOSC domain-containing protein [Bacteroidota bacterium]